MLATSFFSKKSNGFFFSKARSRSSWKRNSVAGPGNEQAATQLSKTSRPKRTLAPALVSNFRRCTRVKTSALGKSRISWIEKLTGVGLEFQVYAALMIGGYSILRGGVGNPIGGALGLLAVAGVANILDLRAISPYYVNIIVGLLLLAAVLLDRLRGGDAYE